MPKHRRAILIATLTCFAISSTGCSWLERDPPLVIDAPYRDAMQPQVQALARCAVDLLAEFRAAAVRETTVACIVATARNQAEITRAAGDA